MDPKRNRIDAGVTWCCAFVLLACALFTLFFAAKTAHLPMQFDYEEGNILNAGMRITQGLTPYPAAESWPIVLNPYGPIPYLLAAFWVKWFGLSFFVPRMVSILSAAVVAMLIGVLIRRFGGSVPIGFIFAGAFLSVGSIRNWMLTSRVDWLALALSFGGLAAFVFWEKRWYVAAILFSAALFTKYTLIAAPLAVGLWLITRQEWKALIRLVLTSLALCIVAFWLTQRWSGGNFAFHQFGTHPDAYDFAQYAALLKGRIFAIPLLLGLAVIAAVRDGVKKNAALPVIYLLTSTLATVTAGKAGSNTNHLIEWTAAICWCAGYGWQYIQSWLAPRKLAIASAATMGALAATSVLAIASYRLPMAGRTSCNSVYAFLKTHGDSVLTDSVGALLIAGKPVLVSNPFVYAQLVSHGKLAKDPVKELVLEKKFDVILLREAVGAYPADVRFTGATLQAIQQNYHEAGEFACYDSGHAYVPNP